MRVLITGPALADPGGVSGYFQSLLPHLRPLLAEVEYLEIGGSRGRGGPLHPLLDQWRFRRALRRFRPDVVHINPSLDLKSFLRDGLFVRAAVARGYPVLVFFRGWDKRFEQQVERAWYWFFNATYRRAAAFIVLASEFRQRLAAWGVQRPIHLGTTAIASDLVKAFSLEQKQATAVGDGVVRVLFLARLERTKGIGETLEALSLLRSRGAAVQLTVAGDGEAMGDVRRFASDHPELRNALSVAGDVRGERKRELLASHDIYCFPSYTEGMPNSVLEAMAFGLPVVTARVGGLADFFEDGRMGCVLQRITASDVAAGIERLVRDPAMRRTIAEHNHRYALANFLAPAAAQRLAAVYGGMAPDPQKSLVEDADQSP